ncbi:MAG: hypothetical protein ACTHU0_23455 [Kofleriaceae bacterium]
MISADYRRNQEIRWLTAPDGIPLPSFMYVGRLRDLKYNFGDPYMMDVIAFESDPVLADSEHFCKRCNQRFEAIAVRIVNGRIASGIAFLPGECAQRFGRDPRDLAIVEITPSGAAIVHDEWIDPPLTWRSNFPSMSQGEHAVAQVDPRTGDRLDEAGRVAVLGEAHYYVLSTLADAESFVEARQRKKPSSEWLIYDASEQVVAHRLAVKKRSSSPGQARASTVALIAARIRSLFRR